DLILFFFFQAEDGIRAKLVTGVQTCALPISIGASRWQLLRQLLIESLLLSVAGGAAGLFLAVAMIRALLSFIPRDSAPLMLKARSEERRVGKEWRTRWWQSQISSRSMMPTRR